MSKRRKAGSIDEGAKRPFTVLSADAFDCAICEEAMISKILQCPAGHSICEDCFHTISSQEGSCCPSCQKKYPSEPIRNLAMEALAAGCEFQCRFGCSFRGKPDELINHHKECTLVPKPCPVPNCPHKCAKTRMKEHLISFHSSNGKATSNATIVVVRTSDYKETLSTKSLAFKNGILLDASKGGVLIWDRRISEGCFRAKVLHFEQPYAFTMTLQQGAHENLSFTVLSRGLGNDNDEQAGSCIQLPQCMYERFVDGSGNANATVCAKEIGPRGNNIVCIT